MSLYARYECDDRAGTLTETAEPTTSQLITGTTMQSTAESNEDRTEPDLDVYADILLLIDALECHAVTNLPALEMETLVTLYTLLSDVQRDAVDFRQAVADVLLDRVHHIYPVHGQYGSVQCTSRRNRSLTDDEEVLMVLEDAGIDRERVMSVDRQKVEKHWA